MSFRWLIRSFPVALLALALALGAACGDDGGGGGEGTPTAPEAGETSTEEAAGDVPPTVDVSDVIDRVLNDIPDERFEEAPQGAPVPQSAVLPGSPQTVVDFLTDVVQDLDSDWTQWFLASELEEPFVSYVIIQPGQSYTMGCGGQLTLVHDTPNAYYCSIDEVSPGYRGTLYLPVTTMEKMWTGEILGQQGQRGGDFAAAIVVAHEFGHHAVDEIQIQMSQRGVQVAPPAEKYAELIADCMAGAWAASAYYKGYLEEGDYEEAVSALEAIGDYEIFSPQHHGTPQERVVALLTGYNGTDVWPPASPEACIEQYWITP